MNETIILVHGYFRSSSDMFYLEKYFKNERYTTISLDLNTTYGLLGECSGDMEYKIRKINKQRGKINFVGHSFGGLIIRHFLSKNKLDNLGRCVLIATPNNGSKLADIAQKLLYYSPFNPFKALESLQNNNCSISKPLNIPPPEIGIIAGKRCNSLLGKLLSSENDGRVEVVSTYLDGMKDFISLPYGHHEIHHKPYTAKLTLNFLQSGKFLN